MAKPNRANEPVQLSIESRFETGGCRPDKYDARDHILFLKVKVEEEDPSSYSGTRSTDPSVYMTLPVAALPSELPSEVDLRPNMPPVLDQGILSSCVTNAISNQLRYVLAKQYKFAVSYNHIHLSSRLAMYFDSRIYESDVLGHEFPYNGPAGEIPQGTFQDSGLITLRSTYKVMRHTGFAPEFSWPYLPSIVNHSPSEYQRAKSIKSANLVRYLRLPNTRMSYALPAPCDDCVYLTANPVPNSIVSIAAALAEHHVVCMGMPFYNSQPKKYQIDPTHFADPEPGEFPIGGHAVLLVGYNANTPDRMFTFQNSWGRNAGMGGYHTLSANFVKYLCWDFWTLIGVDKLNF